MDDLQTIRDLKAEAEKNRLVPDKHNIGSLRQKIKENVARNKRMLTFMDRMLSADDKLTLSQFIEPFLRACVRIVGEETIGKDSSS